MRKARSSRGGVVRDDPTGILARSAQEEEDMNDNDDDQEPQMSDAALPLLEQMEDVDEQQREEAFDMVSSMMGQVATSALAALMDGGLPARLCSGLCDSKAAVRAAAANALRLLCEHGGDAVSDTLVEEDILTPLVALFVRMRVDVPLATPEVRVAFHAVLVNVVAALRELCLRSQGAVDVMSGHAARLVDYLDPNFELPIELRCSAAHILLSIFEGNPELCASIRASARAVALLSGHADAPAGDALLRALCSSVLLAIHGDGDGNGEFSLRCFSTLDRILRLPLPAALLALQPDIMAAAEEASNPPPSAEPLVSPEIATSGGGDEWEVPPVPHVGHATESLQGSISQWMRSAQAQQVALETISNIFAGFQVDKSDVNRARIAVSLLEPCVAIATVQLAQLDSQWGERLLLALPMLDACMEQLQQLQLRSLGCLSNVFIACDATVFAQQGPAAAALWQALLSVMQSTAQGLASYRQNGGTDVSGDELLDGVCQCAWFAARSLGSLLPVQVSHVGGITSLLGQSYSLPAQVALSGLLGVLAPVYRADEGSLRQVTAALQLQLASPSPPCTSLFGEALNALVDIYSDDSTHAAFAALQVGPMLSRALESGRAFCNSAMVGDEVDLESLDGVLQNVEAFLQYKSGGL